MTGQCKHIAIDCRMAGMSGIGVYIVNLVPRCVTAFPQTSFRLIGRKNLPEMLNLPSGTRAAFVPCDIPIYSPLEQPALARLAFGTGGLWVPHYNIPVCAPVPLVATVHDLAHLQLADVFGPLKRAYAKTLLLAVKHRAKAVLFDSTFTKTAFTERIGKPCGEENVIALGVDESWFECVNDTSPYPWPYIVAVGNLKPHKNLAALCRAFAGITGRFPHHLVLAGQKDGFITGSSGETLESVAPGRVHCVGKLPAAELRRTVRHADWLVFPSKYEGFGLPPLEALACKTPVLCAELPSVRETCGDAVRYVNGESAGTLREGLERVLSSARDPGESLCGQALAKTFSWDKTADQTAKALSRAFGL